MEVGMVRREKIMVHIQNRTPLPMVNRSSMPSDRYGSGSVCTGLSAGSGLSISMLSLSMLLYTWRFTRDSICNGVRCTYPSVISMKLQHHRSGLRLRRCGVATIENQGSIRFGRVLYCRWYPFYIREVRLEKQMEAVSDIEDLRLLPSVPYARNELVRV